MSITPKMPPGTPLPRPDDATASQHTEGRWRVDARFVVALIVIALFAYAFWRNPNDATMLGALISAFNIAIGYWLGSSRGSAEHARRAEALSQREGQP